jgi:hypothetical protein
MSFLRLWLGGTLVFVLAAMVWSFAPILIPVVAIAVGMGALVAGIVTLARKLERPGNP